MRTAEHYKRIAGALGLLAALSLTATGCQSAPNTSGAQAAPPTQEAPKVKIADAPMIEGTDLFPTDVPKNQHFTPAEVADIKKTAVTALQIMLEEHPEYTVDGFKPTAETWNSQVAPKLQPISTPQGFQDMKKGWEKAPTGDKKIDANSPEKFFGNPILTNAPDLLDGDSYPTYGLTNTWKSDKGEVCSPSGKPYELNALGVTLSATYADGTYLDATAAGQVEVTVHCKEGGKLTTTVDQNVFLDHSGPGKKFFVGGASLIKTGGSTTAVLTK